MNAATGQKIGLGGTGINVNGLTVAQASLQGTGVAGIGLSSLAEQNKGLMNFNI